MTNKEIRLSQQLNKLIKKNGTNISKLARELGINKSSLHGYCNGVEPSGMTVIRKIANHFNVSIESLIYERDISDIRISIEGDVEGKYFVEVKSLSLKK